jgi:GNAT superfamily N-acetyltransferase
LLAENEDQTIGFALYFFNFSTFLGKPGLYLEDLFVSPEHRGVGVGKLLFKELGKVAAENDCGRMEWMVLDWNEPAQGFYRRIGANPVDGWHVWRMTGSAIGELAD